MNNIFAVKDIENYERYLLDEERSRATIEKYIRDIYKFYQFIKQTKQLTKDSVVAYKAYLSSCYKTSSINSMLASVNSFLQWHGRADLRVKGIKTQRQLFRNPNRELEKTEYEQLIAAARKNNNTRLELVIQTIGGTGIRISELIYITVEAARQGQAVVEAKGKQRIIFFTPKLRKYLLQYCSRRNIKKGPVFVTRTGKTLDRSNIWREMKALCRAAGVQKEKVFPHNLRHLFARICYQKKKDIVYLADLLGHSNIETTRIYTISSGREHKKMLTSLGLVM